MKCLSVLQPWEERREEAGLRTGDRVVILKHVARGRYRAAPRRVVAASDGWVCLSGLHGGDLEFLEPARVFASKAQAAEYLKPGETLEV